MPGPPSLLVGKPALELRPAGQVILDRIESAPDLSTERDRAGVAHFVGPPRDGEMAVGAHVSEMVEQSKDTRRSPQDYPDKGLTSIQTTQAVGCAVAG
jgi:hypothetical protein